jgi:hypothetical protein
VEERIRLTKRARRIINDGPSYLIAQSFLAADVKV